MKKIFRFSLLALFISIASCEDATDIVQESELNEEAAYRNVDDLQSGLNGVYANYGPDFGGNGNGDIILFNDLFTDNIKRGISSNGQGNSEYNFNINTNTNFPNTIWSNRYATINYANRVLRNIDRVIIGASDADIERANHIKAQLLALRALCHFDLFQYFTVDYQNPDSPSVIVMDFVPPLGAVYPRNTVSEVLTLVLSDLEQANALLSDSANDTFYITHDALNVIKARVLLFRGDAANYNELELITEEILVNHPIININGPNTPQDFVDFWSDNNLNDPAIAEDIWTLFRGADDSNVASLFYANSTDLDGSPFFEMSNQLYDSYATSDIRKEQGVWIDESSTINGSNRILLINKYPGGNIGQLSNHIKLFRSAEILLIKAEAEARQGKFDEAEQSVQSLRVARYIGTTPSVPQYDNLTEALDDILLERRRELCFEGHRYLDLKRIGAEINVNINRAPADCASFAAPCDLPSTDYRFTMPIPRVEVDANPTIMQNPNY